MWNSLKAFYLLCVFFFAVILPMYVAEKRAAAAARKRFILDPFSDHLVFVQVFRVSWLLLVMQGWYVAIMKKSNIRIYF